MVKAIGSDSAEGLGQLSDEELMARYREEGRADVFNELVRRYERELYRYLARYLGDPSLAEDVFQNTFLQVHLKRGLFENGRPFRPWLYAIATHQAVDSLRKAGRHPTISLDQRVGGGSNESEAGNLVDLLVGDEDGPPPDLDPRVSPGFEVPGDCRDPEDPGGDREVTPACRAGEAPADGAVGQAGRRRVTP
jgi:RNA polymerase sigma-70 factor (ECF subfamily)